MMVKKFNPWAWIPSLYIAEGMPYIVVMFVASDMYKTLGVSNSRLAFWTSVLYLPWVIKPLWSPFIDLFSTKRNWILAMQLLLGITFMGVAFSLQIPWWFVLSLVLLWFMALISATHDISVDGFYMLALNENRQAFFSGIRSTFYRLSMIAGLGLLVMMTGVILDNTGLDPLKLKVNAVEISEKTPLSGPPEIGLVKSELNAENLPGIIVFPENIEVPLFSEKSNIDSTVVYFRLSGFPDNMEEIKVLFGHKKGSKDIYLAADHEFKFNKDNWSQWQPTTIKVKHNLKEPAEARFDAKSGNIPFAWSMSLGALGILFLIFAVYHRFALPIPASDVTKKRTNEDSYWTVLKSFFETKGIVPAIFFLLFYRFAESQLTKMASPFLLDSVEQGGIGLSLTEKGFVYGTAGVIALVVGGILGGVIASKHGLKKWIWWMAASINLPNFVYIYMAYFQPSNMGVISSMVAVEQFGYGFGFTAYMLFMLYLVKDSKYKTAHYAITTGFMALGMMLPGMVSGKVQEMLGYGPFFIYVMICTIPSFIALFYVYRNMDPTFGMKKE